MIAARSSGCGSRTQPSQVNASSSFLIISKVSMSNTRVSRSMHSLLTFGSKRLETNSTFVPEWVRILVTSCSEESGRIGTMTRRNGVVEKNATVQFGMFWERIATLSPALTPNRDIRWDRSRQRLRKEA